MNKASLWSGVLSAVQNGSAEEVKKLACPKCGAGLSLKYDPLSPQPDATTAGLLKINCWSCVAGVFMDGLTHTPPWIEILGPTVETRPDTSPG